MTNINDNKLLERNALFNILAPVIQYAIDNVRQQIRYRF